MSTRLLLNRAYVINTKKLLTNPSIYNSLRFNSTDTIIEKAQIVNNEPGFISNKISVFSDSPLADIFSDAMISMHDLASLEWSSTIMISAFIFRLAVCFPIKVYQEKLIAKMINLQPQIQEAVERRFKDLNLKSRFLSDDIKRKMNADLIRIRNAFYQKENCAPQKIPISSLLQMPFWIYMSAAIRNLTSGIKGNAIQMEEMRNESFAWLTSLATNDPTFVLPALYAIFAFANLKYATLNSKQSNNNSAASINKIYSFRKYLTMSFICVLTVLIANMPASVGLFWISSNVLSLIELIILDSILIRRFLRIPSTSIDPKNIYKFKYDVLLGQLKNLTKKFTH